MLYMPISHTSMEDHVNKYSWFFLKVHNQMLQRTHLYIGHDTFLVDDWSRRPVAQGGGPDHVISVVN